MEDITQEEIEQVRKLREQAQKQKPVDIKKNIEALIASFKSAKSIYRYDVKEKSYPHDLSLLCDGGNRAMKNPTIVKYIAKAECKFVEEHQKEILEIVSEMIEAEIEEIRSLVNG